MNLTGKRKKIYEQLIKEGKSEAYAKRISRGLSEGKTLLEARGHKEIWSAYAYVDAISSMKTGNTYLSMSSRDLSKTREKTYRMKGEQEALYRIHQFLEDETNQYFIHENLEIIFSNFSDLYIDTHEKQTKRQFVFEIADVDTLEIRFFILFEKGKIKKSKVWEGFPIVEFQVLIGQEELWN